MNGVGRRATDPTTPSVMDRLPRWLGPANRLITALQRRGVAFFTFYLLTVPGRVSGILRTTPVSPVFLDGACYLVSIGETEWVKNARVSGWGKLARGRREWRVTLEELGPEVRVPVLRAFPVEVPHGVPFLVQIGAVAKPGDPDAFEAAAGRLAVFRAIPAD
jgi:hypothetical protein